MSQWPPLLAAVMVLIGVILTIWYNNRRAVFERLEQRAKDRELALQSQYSSFAIGGYGVLSAVGILRAAKISRQQMDSGQLKLDTQQLEARAKKTLNMFDDATDIVNKSLADARSAFSVIVLIDKDQKRINQARDLLRDLYTLPNNDDDGSVGTSLDRQLQQFLVEVGVALQQEYVAALDLARKGQPYVP